MSPGKMTEPIEMPFRVLTRMVRRNHVFEWWGTCGASWRIWWTIRARQRCGLLYLWLL